MNPRQANAAPAAVASVLEARFGFRIASLLSEQTERLPHDVAERLKFARKQAMDRVQAARQLAPAGVATQVSVQGSGRGLSLLGGGSPGWMRWASILPLVALVAGLFLIQDEFSSAQVQTAADVDAALLGDDLPPSAYDDAGFVEFLKTPRN